MISPETFYVPHDCTVKECGEIDCMVRSLRRKDCFLEVVAAKPDPFEDINERTHAG